MRACACVVGKQPSPTGSRVRSEAGVDIPEFKQDKETDYIRRCATDHQQTQLLLRSLDMIP